MRSSFHPYTLLIKSKKPEIQSWLVRAETMTEPEIKQLKLKPDLQRAMLYVAQQKSQKDSSEKAQHLADQMQSASSTKSVIMQIYCYHGVTRFVDQNQNSSVDLKTGAYFGVLDNNAFVNNCWVPLSLNPDLISHSEIIENGDATRLNILNKQRRNKEYGV